MKFAGALALVAFASLTAVAQTIYTSRPPEIGPERPVPAMIDESKLKIVSLQPAYKFHLLAVGTADTDGKRPAAITAGEVQKWVDKTNAILAAANANISVVYTQASDFVIVKNTALNSLSSGGGGWKDAEDYVAAHSGRLVIFFRFGDAAVETGNGFAFHNVAGFADTHFIVLPGFTKTGVKSNGEVNVQNIWQMAHDLGHFLGLGHTFPGSSGKDTMTEAAALSFIAKNGGTAKALDGDGVPDTTPDAGAAFFDNYKWANCSDHDQYTIPIRPRAGEKVYNFSTPRHNVMSYFACETMQFTPGQVSLMRKNLGDAFYGSLLMPAPAGGRRGRGGNELRP